MKQKNKNKQGAAIILYLLIMAIFISILMATTYSRLLLSVKRSASSADTLIANYAAESEINDILARLSGGYLKAPLSLNPPPKQIGNTKLTISGSQTGDIQTIVVTADRAFASSKLIAERTVTTTSSVQKVDIVLALDCTGSMGGSAISNAGFVPPDPSRFDALKSATLNFINALEALPDSGSFRLGISVFGVDAKWLTIGGQEVTPEADMPLSQIEAAVRQGIGYQNGAEVPSGISRNTSPACKTVRDGTSVGSAFSFSHDYFSANKVTGTKQIEIVITDGEPNSRIVYPACAPSIECGNTCRAAGFDFLACTSADIHTGIPAYDIYAEGERKGVRDPNVDAYAITILQNPPLNVTQLLSKNLGDKYFNAERATELNSYLTNIFHDIVTSRESFTIKKVIPGS